MLQKQKDQVCARTFAIESVPPTRLAVHLGALDVITIVEIGTRPIPLFQPFEVRGAQPARVGGPNSKQCINSLTLTTPMSRVNPPPGLSTFGNMSDFLQTFHISGSK